MIRLAGFMRAPSQLATKAGEASSDLSSGTSLKMSARDVAIEQLAVECFSKGNKILKVVEEMTALPEGRHSFPEVCFVGKPNCGKSSLVGALCHNRRMGRSGRLGGQTKKLEFFNVGDGLLLVDTPGYGAWSQGTIIQNTLSTTLLRRYISLRKSSNLKQVYWMIECLGAPFDRRRWMQRTLQQEKTTPLGLGPRDEEMRDFLLHENVPFTILLSKVDRLKRDTDIHYLVDTVYNFLQRDDVPVMPVACIPARPNACRHTHELMCDIMEKCTRELRDDELTMKGLHSLSYLPPTAQDMIRVEADYPHGASVIPKRDKDSLEHVVQLHNEAKRGFIDVRQQSKLLSAGQFEKALSIDANESSPERSGASNSVPLLEHSGAISPAAHVVTVGHLTAQPNSPLELANLLPSTQADSTQVSNVLGVSVPRTMISSQINLSAQKMDQSAEGYAAMIDQQGYYGVLNASEEFFVTAEGSPTLAEMNYRERKSGPRYVSHREKSSQRMMQKFVQRQRKGRSIQLDAQGYMCPWLGSSEGPSRRRVMGASTTPPGGSSSGGALVRNLKGSGFGGRSVSRKTLKNTFRATKKTGVWAT